MPVRQFISSYKRLLMRHDIKGGLGNCLVLDNTQGLACKGKPINTDEHMLIDRRHNLAEPKPLQSDHDYADVPNIVNLSEFKLAAVSYIAGFVARKVSNLVSCDDCRPALKEHGCYEETAKTQFLLSKDKGGLVKPSTDVINICRAAEKSFQRMLAATNGKPPQTSNLANIISNTVLSDIGASAFPSLEAHQYDCPPEHNHIFILVKSICRCYCQIRMFHLAKSHTDDIVGTKVRRQFTKLIIFHHQ